MKSIRFPSFELASTRAMFATKGSAANVWGSKFWGASVLGIAAVLAVAAPTAHAGPLSAFSFAGEGNVLVFDAVAGTGGWNGAITEFTDPPRVQPLSFASLVTFSYNAAANVLSGQFEFTHALDLSSSVFGTLMGRFTDPAGSLTSGGQFELDYSVLGGSGQFAGSSGYGLSFLSFDPNASSFNNYREDGLLVVDAATVPLPNSLLLVALALALAGWAVRPAQSRSLGAA